MVTVVPLLSHNEWKVLLAQPSTDARQQRFQWEDWLCATGCNQMLKEVKNLLSFCKMTEFAKPAGKPLQEKWWEICFLRF